jgi:hypothetical protein
MRDRAASISTALEVRRRREVGFIYPRSFSFPAENSRIPSGGIARKPRMP